MNNLIKIMIFFFFFKHRPSDTAYYIAKELLMTERTYKKDLEVICVVSNFIRQEINEAQFGFINEILKMYFILEDPEDDHTMVESRLGL